MHPLLKKNVEMGLAVGRKMLEETELSQALNFAERTSPFPSTKQLFVEKSPAVARKIDWWTRKYFRNKKSLFVKYLQDYGVKVDDIQRIYNTHFDTSALKNDCDEIWSCQKDYSIPVMYSEQWGGYGFENVCRPVLAYAQEKIEQAIICANEYGLVIDKNNVLREADSYLRQRLNMFISPALILEANLARLQATGSEEGASERFESFIINLGLMDNQRYFWSKYPVLWRLVSVIVSNAVAACSETLSRLAKDRSDLEKIFGLKEHEKLCSIKWGKGDAHCGGRVVAIIEFENKRLVYKPKNMVADKAYNEFIDWYSSVAGNTALSSCLVLTRDGYGYKSFIEFNECQSQEDVRSFYTKLGSLIAIAWVLGITDLHHENMVASGSEPYLIDVEAMFSKPLRYHTKGKPSQEESMAQAFYDLLFGTGLIPMRMQGVDGVYDISAVGARGEQSPALKVLVQKNYGRDDVRLEPEAIPIQQEQNVPILNGVVQRCSDFLPQIIAGFESAVEVLEQQKDFLLGKQSIMEIFWGAPVRYISRNTMDYGKLLQGMAHPTVLGNAIECDMLMGGALRNALDYAPHLAPLVSEEIRDLWNGDIPYFFSFPESKTLYSSTGKIFENFFEETGTEKFKERVNLLRKIESHHLAAIRSSVKSTMPLRKKANTTFDVKKHTTKISKEELVKLASDIGVELLDSAYYVGNNPQWVGFVPVNKKDWSASIVHASMYDGAPGIGIFFSQLYRVTQNQSFRKIALDIHAGVKGALKSKQNSQLPMCGAFSGYGGLIYADVLMNSVFCSSTRGDMGPSFSRLKKMVAKDDNYDLISGAAGALVVSMQYYRLTGNNDALQAAKVAAERLEAASEKQEKGVAWLTLKDEEKRLGGLSHGVSGIAWALAEWADYTKSKKWEQLAQQAFAYEQSFYDPCCCKWHDARGGLPVCFWCYGAGGIGIATSHMQNVLGKKKCENVLKITKQLTWKYGFMNNHCLCHGNLGNSDLFLLTGDKSRANTILNYVVADYKSKKRWACGLPGNATTPGLMCGLAGIGYGLLRHAFPDEVPSVLNLELANA